MRPRWPLTRSGPASSGGPGESSPSGSGAPAPAEAEGASGLAGRIALLAGLSGTSHIVLHGATPEVSEKLSGICGVSVRGDVTSDEGFPGRPADAVLIMFSGAPDDAHRRFLAGGRHRMRPGSRTVALVTGGEAGSDAEAGIVLRWVEMFTSLGMAAAVHRLDMESGRPAAIVASGTRDRDGTPAGAGDRSSLRIECFKAGNREPGIRPATVRRGWMDATPDKYAYRCLPLNIANAHCWEILCPAGFTAIWNGGRGVGDLVVDHDESGGPKVALSHFGSAILTFHVECLFRTEPGFDLWVTGPVNEPRDRIYPLTGLVETDWLDFTFTMNWLITAPNFPKRKKKGEPFCAFFPVERGLIERFDPIVRELSEEPGLERAYTAYSESRTSFNKDLKRPGSEAERQKWQRTYVRGPGDKPEIPVPHRTRVTLRPFRRRR